MRSASSSGASWKTRTTATCAGSAAEQLRPHRLRRFQFRFGVDLEEHVEAQFAGEAAQLDERGEIERCGDEEHRVGAVSSRLPDLVRRQETVLQEHRQAAGGTGLYKILEGAAETRPLGEDRHAGRSALLVGPREAGGIEVLRDDAAARRSALHLGDQRVVASRLRGHQGRDEAARRLPLQRPRPDLRERGPRRPRSHLLERGVYQPFEMVVAHEAAPAALRARVACTNRSSRAAAAPESIACSASRTPSRKVSQTPEAAIAAAELRSTALRRPPFSPRNTETSSSALRVASPPRSSSMGAGATPSSSGVTCISRAEPLRVSATRVGPAVEISSSPPYPWTTNARS